MFRSLHLKFLDILKGATVADPVAKRSIASASNRVLTAQSFANVKVARIAVKKLPTSLKKSNVVKMKLIRVRCLTWGQQLKLIVESAAPINLLSQVTSSSSKRVLAVQG